MIQRHLATLSIVAAAAFGFAACDDDDPAGDGPDPTPDAAPDGGGGVGGMGGQGGTGGVGGMGGQGGMGGMGGVPIEEQTIGEFVDRTCFVEGDETPPELLDGLSRQLVDAIDCVRPGTLSDLPDGNWRPWDPTRRMLVDGRGVDDLLAAAADGDRTMVVKWAYRDVALQHLFYLWTLKSCDFAAPPGLSNHQNGLSVDLIEPAEWSVLMRAYGWEDNLPTDRPHFDYVLAEDVGLARLSLFAFQALHNRNRPDALVRLTGEFDEATQQALTDAPIGGFGEGLCDGGVQPPEPPAFGGPTLAQSAWRGCDAPIPLIEGLSAEIADTMACADPDAVAALDPCGEAGCLAIVDPPVPEWLEAATHAALLEVSTQVDAPIGIAWGGRDAALTWFFHAAQRNLSCPGGVPFPTVAPFASGRAVTLSQADAMNPAVTAAMADVGFVQLGDRDWLYPDGADLRALTVYAFQVLWNANRPDDPLATDGVLGPDTLAALDRAPIGGFGGAVCADLEPPDPPLDNDLRCVDDCFNQDCPGTYEFCADEACIEVPCDADLDCSGLVACDDPGRGSSPFFYCDDGRCRRLR